MEPEQLVRDKGGTLTGRPQCDCAGGPQRKAGICGWAWPVALTTGSVPALRSSDSSLGEGASPMVRRENEGNGNGRASADLASALRRVGGRPADRRGGSGHAQSQTSLCKPEVAGSTSLQQLNLKLGPNLLTSGDACSRYCDLSDMFSEQQRMARSALNLLCVALRRNLNCFASRWSVCIHSV